MIFIYEKYNNLNEKKLSVSQIRDHLKTMYDFNSLDGRGALRNSIASSQSVFVFLSTQNENDVAPFPAEQVDFSLSSRAK